ncbi:tRNA lysidine(34) synthetase TilS [Porticoccus sp. W117]|uniref:tRNA lysidine(34) synthetase TilS n=1 Tax=Porticoccus sp. W117 TaxID=3054777 RepID=UPI0025973C4F|nr:tRNA lysidine(34) synthetase TilS [Porticoccus sp. W117]MDM3870279.1 tRNA lysidine(34) synthetase TilS [Porticoccus sp. W117]
MFTTDLLAPDLATLQNAERVYVGYSGGLDSQVLLHAVVTLLGPEKITALHINHQISPNADNWQAHCAEQCRQLDVPLQAFRVELEPSENIELAARNARYKVFEAALDDGDLLLLAHHADDQSETVLYRLMRCSGPRGLAGMPRSRSLGKGQLLRPLLDISREELHQYARHHRLQWVEDESNQQLTYDRNYLRHSVVPAIEKRWPDLAKRLSQVATLCADSDELNRQLATTDLQAGNERQERLGVSIEQQALAQLSHLRRHNLIRFWLEKHHYAMPPKKRLELIHRELLEAKADASPIVDFGDCQLRRYNNRVYLLPPLPPALAEGTEITWDGKQPLYIEGCGKLTAAEPFAKPVTVRFRQGGERCQPDGRNSSQTLKKLLQEYHLEPWLRDRVPLLYKCDQLIAAADLFSEAGLPKVEWSLDKNATEYFTSSD